MTLEDLLGQAAVDAIRIASGLGIGFVVALVVALLLLKGGNRR